MSGVFRDGDGAVRLGADLLSGLSLSDRRVPLMTEVNGTANGMVVLAGCTSAGHRRLIPGYLSSVQRRPVGL